MLSKKQEKITEISVRVESLIKDAGESPNSFAKALGYSRAQTVYDIINGKAAPSYDFFNKFAVSEYSESYNIHWLLTGNGSMLRTGESATLLEPQSPHELEVCRTLLKEKDALILEQAKEIGRLEERLSNFQTRSRSQSLHGTAIPVPDPSEISRDMPNTSLPPRTHPNEFRVPTGAKRAKKSNSGKIQTISKDRHDEPCLSAGI